MSGRLFYITKVDGFRPVFSIVDNFKGDRLPGAGICPVQPTVYLYEMKLWSALFLSALLLPQALPAQEMWGASNSNFAGILGLRLNPSSIVYAPYSRELGILSADFFAANNYIYIRKGYGLFGKQDANSEHGSSGDDYTPRPLKKAYLSTVINLPSYIRNNGRSAWAVYGSVRSATSAADIPYHIAKFIYEGFNYGPQQQIEYSAGPFETTGMAWYELGGTYAWLLSRQGSSNVWKAGVDVNLLFGTDALYLKAANMDYTVPQDGLLVVHNINAEYGHALPENYRQAGRYFTVRGFGASTALGLTYIHHVNRAAYACKPGTSDLRKYDFRLGISLVDAGLLQLNSRETGSFIFKNNSTYWPGVDTTGFYGWYAMDTLLSNRFYGNPVASAYKKKFTLYTPAGVSVQLDINPAPSWYLNLSGVLRTPVGRLSVLRPDQAALTPRYETRRFEVDLPVTYYDGDGVSVGLAARYGILTIGTDRLGAFTGLYDTYAFDFFFALRLQRCGTGTSSRKTRLNCPVNY
jgi:hypothetical protein